MASYGRSDNVMQHFIETLERSCFEHASRQMDDYDLQSSNGYESSDSSYYNEREFKNLDGYNYQKREQLIKGTTSKEEAEKNATELIESIEKEKKTKSKKQRRKERKKLEKQKIEEAEKKKLKHSASSKDNLTTGSIESLVSKEDVEGSNNNSDEVSADPNSSENLNLDNIPAFVSSAIKRNKTCDGTINKKDNAKEANRKSSKNLESRNDDNVDNKDYGRKDTAGSNFLISDAANFTTVRNTKRTKPIGKDSYQLGIQGIELILNDRLIDAIKCFSDHIAQNPVDVKNYINRSYCYLRMGHYSMVVSDMQFVFKNTCDTKELAKALYRGGQAFYGLQKYEQAEKCFNESLNLDPWNQHVHRQLVRMQVDQLVNMGFRERRAIEALQQCAMNTLDSIAFLAEQSLNTSPDDNHSNTYFNHEEIYHSDEDEPSNTELISSIIRDKIQVVKKNALKNVEYKSLISTANNGSVDTINKTAPKSGGTMKIIKATADKMLTPKKSLTNDKAVWVGNLTPEITDSMLKTKFSRFGKVVSIYRKPNEAYAFVNYNTATSVTQLFATSTAYEVNGIKLLVKPATQRTDK